MKYKIETHAHTSPASPCSDIPPEKLVKAYKDIGVHAVCITNHFIPEHTVMGKDKFINFYLKDFYDTCNAGEKYGVKIILGMEIRFAQNWNDYLVYGIDEDFVKASFSYLDTTIEKFYKEMKNDKNVILQAHPFRNGMVLADTDSIDGIEVFNMHLGHNSRVAQASMYASKHPEFIVTAGSDYHHEGHQGTGLILSHTLPENSFQFAEILKSKNYMFLVGNSKVIPYE